MNLDTTIHLTITSTKTMDFLNNDPTYSNFLPLQAATHTEPTTSDPTKDPETSTSREKDTPETELTPDLDILSSSHTITTSASSHTITTSSPISTSTSTSTSSNYQTSATTTNSQVATSSGSLDKLIQYKSNDSATLGMAIGIPVGVVLLLLISIGTWYYLKTKKATNKTILPLINNQRFFHNHDSTSEILSFNEKQNPYLTYYNHSSDQNPPQNSLQKPSKNPLGLDLELENHHGNKSRRSLLTPINFKSVPAKINTKSQNWFNRLSRVVRIDNSDSIVKDEEAEIDTRISPLFLKRFNLNKPLTPKTPNLKSKNKFDNEDYKKPLPKLPSLIQMENVKEDLKFMVIEPYAKSLDDEVTISIGDEVRLIKNYPDHWCLIKNLSSGKTGMIPRQCLQKVQL